MAEHLKKRADGRYALKVRTGLKGGKPTYKMVYGKTESEVKRKQRKLEQEVENGMDLSAEKMTVSELLDLWYSVKKKGKLKQQTENNYKWKIKAIKALIGELKIKSVKISDILLVRDHYMDSGKISTAYHLNIILRSAFSFAVNNSYIAKNPCAEITISSATREREILTEVDRKRIERANIGIKDCLIIYFGLYAGLRIGETYALKISDIDIEKRLFNVNKTIARNDSAIQDTTKTKSGIRTVPILDPLYPILKQYLAIIPKDQVWLFVNNKGTYYHDTISAFKKIKNDIGLRSEITYHCLRHTFITDCYWAGVKEKQLAAWVGHKDMTMIMRIYAHLDPKQLSDTSEINAYFKRESEWESKRWGKAENS